MGAPLHDKYRPRNWDEVVGQAATVKSLRKVLADGSSHAFLFAGPAGVGKTSLARLAAAELGAGPADILERDAATYSGVDDMRKLTDGATYLPFGGSKVKVFIIDECQRASKAAWDSLLKVTEEPPAWVYWFFCTTDPQRVPATIKSRCSCYTLKTVKTGELGDLIEEIASVEKISLPSGAIDLIAREAGGSPRRALVFLAQCAGAKDKVEVADIIHVAAVSEAPIALARVLLYEKQPWEKAMQFIDDLGDENPESVRRVVLSYVEKFVRGANSERSQLHGLRIMDAFMEPFDDSLGTVPLTMAIGRALRS